MKALWKLKKTKEMQNTVVKQTTPWEVIFISLDWPDLVRISLRKYLLLLSNSLQATSSQGAEESWTLFVFEANL